LPFYSYGGSSLMMCCAMIGIVMRIAYETKQVEEGHELDEENEEDDNE
jgi:cell division protein FtsW